MKHIPLTQGKVAIVDDKDYEYLNQWKWYAHKKGNTYYARRSINYKLNGKKKTRTIQMHNIVLSKTDVSKEIDHKNHNGLDNRLSNLRICTHAQNLANQRIRTIRSCE